MTGTKFEIGVIYELTPNVKFKVENRQNNTVTFTEQTKNQSRTVTYPIHISNDNQRCHEYVELDIWDRNNDCYYELYSFETENYRKF